jgi:hypothetical protein
MADTENQYHKPVVLQGANKAIISYAVFPEFAQSTLQSLANLTGIVELLHSLAEKIEDPVGNRFVELP